MPVCVDSNRRNDVNLPRTSGFGWDGQTIRYYVDSQIYQTIDRDHLDDGEIWIYNHPFYIILNIAGGGR